MGQSDQCKNWRDSLRSRHNLLYNDIPYIPTLVEDISMLLSFADFEENSIKTIQTLGEFIPENETNAKLLSLTRGNNSEFPISLKNLSVHDIYIKNSNNTYCAIWEKYIVFRVYGTLKKYKAGYILDIIHIVPVQDIIGTWNVMIMLITIARSEYRQYYRTEGQNRMLQSQWNEMKENKKRVVKEISDKTV